MRIMRYYYGMYTRNTLQDCMSSDGFVHVCEWVPKKFARYIEILEFSRKLTDEEISTLELNPICES